MDELMGNAEIQRLLRLSRQRVSQLVAEDDFPEPVAELAAGKVWRTEDVEQWARQVGRIS